jgi:hypothetical protein
MSAKTPNQPERELLIANGDSVEYERLASNRNEETPLQSPDRKRIAIGGALPHTGVLLVSRAAYAKTQKLTNRREHRSFLRQSAHDFALSSCDVFSSDLLTTVARRPAAEHFAVRSQPLRRRAAPAPVCFAHLAIHSQQFGGRVPTREARPTIVATLRISVRASNGLARKKRLGA